MQRKRPAGGESQAKPPEYRRDAPHTDGGGGSGNLSACAQRIWWWHQSIPKRSPLRCRIPLPLSLHIHRLALAFSRQLRGFFFFFFCWAGPGTEPCAAGKRCSGAFLSLNIGGSLCAFFFPPQLPPCSERGSRRRLAAHARTPRACAHARRGKFPPPRCSAPSPDADVGGDIITPGKRREKHLSLTAFRYTDARW